MPITAPREECAGGDANSKSEQADHVRCDWKFYKLTADRHRDSTVHLCEEPIRGLYQPAVQFLFCGKAIFRSDYSLPQILVYRLAFYSVCRQQPGMELINAVNFRGALLRGIERDIGGEHVNANRLVITRQRQ